MLAGQEEPMQTQVLIIGGGATGTGLARDLALRGVACVLVEKQDINAGASGANHGLLHSGARYIASDPAAACECKEEGALLKRLAPHCVEDTGGLFVAVAGDDEAYVSDFAARCQECDIAARAVDLKDALEMEPILSPDAIAVYSVPDACVDPFKLSLDNLADAKARGTKVLRQTEIVSFEKEGARIRRVHLRNRRTGAELSVEAEQIVNATGAWAGEVAAMAGAKIKVLCSQGSLIITQNRISHRVINRLRRADDADILVPGGTVSIFGTTSVRVDDPDQTRPTVAEIDAMLPDGIAMVPKLAETRFIRAYAGVRPLVQSDPASDDRAVSRGFALIDHTPEGIDNFVTITGGKLTTYRLMAEKTANRVCERLGVTAACLTRTTPLPATTSGKWTEPGLTPKLWFQQKNKSDLLLCECEMVPTSVVNEISAKIEEEGGRPSLRELGQRSRVGKGPCQGAFCSLRLTAHLYNEGRLETDQGLAELRDFLNERWRGVHPLLWGQAVAQTELQEALHCGLFGLELTMDPVSGD
jgi:glycerol-3-phosphate dehydrogenase